MFTLTLRDSSILSLIETVSLKTGKNFIVHPSVSGDVTVISNKPVNAEKLYSIFLSVLQVHGYSAVTVGDIIKILPSSHGSKSPIPVVGENSEPGDQLVRKIVAVKHVPARDLIRIMEPMVDEGGLLAVFPAANALVITDRASNISSLEDMIRLIDRPDQKEVELISIRHASASDIAQTLAPLQQISATGAYGPDLMQIFPDDRSNSVLISGSPAVRQRVRSLIAKLDLPLGSLGGGTRVIPLRFAKADDLATILRGTFNSETDPGETNKNYRNPSERLAGQDREQNDIEYTEDEPLSDFQVPVSPTQSTSESVIIQTDPNTNSLVVTAPPDDMRRILDIISELDVRRPQVMVRAVIAEITEDNMRELGINFLLDASGSTGAVGYSNLGGATGDLASTIDLTGDGNVVSALDNGLSFALGKLSGSGVDFGLLFRAIASDSDNNILSTPTIVTLDNEPAEIVVGSNVPFVTGQQLSADNDNPFQTIERVDVGLTLRVKPQISHGNTIKLDLEQEVSNVNTTAITGASDITTSKRALSTTVLVENGQTLILGGLLDEQYTDIEEKIPLLGDIPMVGKLFRYKSELKSKKNLMIFLHPVILRDAEDASLVSQDSYQQLHQRQQSGRLDLSELPDLSNQRRSGRFADINTRSLAIDSNVDRISKPQWIEQPDGSFVLR